MDDTLSRLRQSVAEASAWFRQHAGRQSLETFRSEELIDEGYEPLFKPENYNYDQLSRLVQEVMANRQHRLSKKPAFSGLLGGRLLRHNFGETTFTTEAKHITKGFIDDYDVPTWDSWVGYVRDFDVETENPLEYLVCWIPKPFCDSIDQAVTASFEENLIWLDTCSTKLTQSFSEDLKPIVAQSDAPRGGVWDDLPLLTSRDGPLEALAGSNLSGRIAGSGKVPDGVYKFVIDKNGKAWLQRASDGLPHSALVPKGEQVRGAGYIAIKNGRANISGRSGHYMKDAGFEVGEAWSRYDAAIRRTFGNWFEIVEHNMGGAGIIRPPGS